MKVRCLGCGMTCDANRSGRCRDCRLAKQRQVDTDPRRALRKAALYDSEHRALRKAWAPIVARGGVRCARCDTPIEPGAPWDLGHQATTTSRPEHANCNRAAH